LNWRLRRGQWTAIAFFISVLMCFSHAFAQETPSLSPSATPRGSYVTQADIYVRGGPGEEFVPVGSLVAGDPLLPASRNSAGDWVLIIYYRGYGWIRRDLAYWDVNIDTLPIIDETNLTPTIQPGLENATPYIPTPTPTGNWADVGERGGFLRAGPGLDYPIVGVLEEGEIVAPVGRDTDTDWILIQADEGFAWVYRPLIRWTEPLDTLPVLLEGALTPSLTYTPTPTLTATLTPSATLTYTDTFTPTNTDTATLSATPTLTLTPTTTYTLTNTPTASPTQTLTPSPTSTLTSSATLTFIPTNTPGVTALATLVIPTATPTQMFTPTIALIVETFVFTATSTDTPQAATDTLTPSPTHSPTFTNTDIATQTQTLTSSPTLTLTQTLTTLPSATLTDTSAPTSLPTSQAPLALPATQAETLVPTVVPSATPLAANGLLASDLGATATRIALETLVAAGQATLSMIQTQTAQLPPTQIAALSTTTIAITPSLLPSDTPLPPTPIATPTPIAVVVSESDTLVETTDTQNSDNRFPWELLVGGLALLGVIGYIALYWRGASKSERYVSGFVIDRCPVCGRGTLIVEMRETRLLGIPQIHHTVRCSACRSVLREVDTREWRYAVDPLENPHVFERFNNRVLDETELGELGAQHVSDGLPTQNQSGKRPPKNDRTGQQ